MRYCSEDAPRTGERNVNFNKTTSENAVLNKTKDLAVVIVYIDWHAQWLEHFIHSDWRRV